MGFPPTSFSPDLVHYLSGLRPAALTHSFLCASGGSVALQARGGAELLGPCFKTGSLQRGFKSTQLRTPTRVVGANRWAKLPPLGKDFSWPQMISGSRLTLFSECFSFVPRGTCALSVSRRYLTFNGTVTTGCLSHTLKWLDFALEGPRHKKVGAATRRSLSLALPFQAVFASPPLHGTHPPLCRSHSRLLAETRVRTQVV